MATTLVNFRLDQETKSSMEQLCQELGISMSAAFTLFAKAMNREQGIPFDVSLSKRDGAEAQDDVAPRHIDPAVVARDVVRTYGEGNAARNALDGLSLEIHRGEFVAIIGASGSGKSTLLHILGGVDKPTSGQVLVDGIDPSTLSENGLALYRRRTVGLVYQFHNLIPFLSVRDNIELPLRFDGRKADGERVAELVGLLGLSGLQDKVPGELSGGEQQRVAIARALVTQPSVVLADEPTGSLDRANGDRVVSLLREANRSLKQTIVLVTHDEHVAAAADRVITISDGRVVSEGRQEC